MASLEYPPATAHWLLTTSDREHGGTLVLGIFGTREEAWDHYNETHNDDERYYRIPFVECWVGSQRIDNAEKVGATDEAGD